MGNRTALFSRVQPGGVFTISDVEDHPGDIWFVDSGSGVDGAGYGRNPDAPLATLDYAVGLCTAGKGDVIYLMPGHNENIGNAQIDLDVAGISVIGLGRGSNRPRFDFDHANASIDIGANGVTLKNITLLPSVTDVLIGIDVEAGKTDVLIEDVEALPGEDGAGVDDFAVMIELKAGCDRTTIIGCRERSHASAAGYQSMVHLKGASHDVTVKNCQAYLFGAGLVAMVHGDTTLSLNLLCEGLRAYLDAEPIIEVLTGTTGNAVDCIVCSDLATLNAGIVADSMARFGCYIAEVDEAGGVIGTPTVDD